MCENGKKIEDVLYVACVFKIIYLHCICELQEVISKKKKRKNYKTQTQTLNFKFFIDI